MKAQFFPEAVMRSSAWSKMTAQEKFAVEKTYRRIQTGDRKKCKDAIIEVRTIAKKHGIKVTKSADWMHYTEFRRRDLDGQKRTAMRDMVFYGAATV